MNRFFRDPHYTPPAWRRWVLLALALVGGGIGFLWLRQVEHEEKTVTYLPIQNFEIPIVRDTKTVHLPPNRTYAKIPIPFEAIAINGRGDIVGYEKRADGRLDLMIWSGGVSYEVPSPADQPFLQVLDINDENEVLVVVQNDDQVFLMGYAYRAMSAEQMQLVPLKRIDLRRFGLEDLTIKTDLTLDSSVGQVTGRKIKVRSIIDMNQSGVILADDPEKDAP